MNKVEKLKEKIRLYTEKISKQIEKIRSKCKHKNIDRWKDNYYNGFYTECKDCGKEGYEVGL